MTSGSEDGHRGGGAGPPLPAIADLIPHAGLMCLLDRIVAWDEGSVTAASRSHQRPDNPLLRAGRLDSVHLCEYGAQAMAVHGGLLAHRGGTRAAPGFLVSLREVWLGAGSVEGLAGELEVVATRLHGDGSGWQYRFCVSHAGVRLASGRAAVVLRHG